MTTRIAKIHMSTLGSCATGHDLIHDTYLGRGSRIIPQILLAVFSEYIGNFNVRFLRTAAINAAWGLHCSLFC
jgi:hypothetical protein